jgi:WD repeat-containing protein 19
LLILDLAENKAGSYDMKVERSSYPFYLNNGSLYCYLKTSKEIKSLILQSHYWIFNWRENGDNEDGHKKYFMQNYQLGRYWNCMKAASYLGTQQNDYLEQLGKEALKHLKIEVAEESFRRAKNISLALTVEKLKNEHEKNILLGHIATILGEENKAQDFFRNSSNPSLAVDLRCDLQEWNAALQLAKEYTPYRENFISKKLAYHYESQNNTAEAMKMYEKSVIGDINKFIHESSEEIDKDGILCY